MMMIIILKILIIIIIIQDLYRLNNCNYGQKAKCRNLQAKA